MVNIFIILASFIGSFVGAWIATVRYHKRNWEIEFDSEKNEIGIRDNSKGGRVEFIESPDAEEYDEIEEEINNPKLKKFFDSFKIKP